MVDPIIEGKDGVNAVESGGRSEPETKQEPIPPAIELLWREAKAGQHFSARKVEHSYDKAVLILSSGALGLSLAVIQDYLRLRGGGSGLLALALLSWALSVSCILFSWKAIGVRLRQMGGGTTLVTYEEAASNRVVAGLSTGAGVLLLLGVVLFAIYVAFGPRASAKEQQAPAAAEEITRVLALYDTIREVCPECSATEARKVLQTCESSYIVPEVLRDACPHCTERGILQLDRRCMEKWNKSR